MNNQPPQTDDDDEIINSIEQLLGTMTNHQRAETLEAIHENPEGVLKLAQSIALNPTVQRPVAVFMTSTSRGDHNKPTRTKRPTTPTKPLDKAHQLYAGKMRDLEQTPWSQAERIEFAIDYALDHCGAAGQALLDTEHHLRLELHTPRWTPTPNQPQPPSDPAKYTEHHHLMQETHGPGDHA